MAAKDPVQKQFINLSLTGGVNKKKDAHQLSNGELLTAENVIFSAVDGQITKRYGFQAVTPEGASFQGGPFQSLGARDNVEPLVLGKTTLNKYNVAKNLSTNLSTPTQGRLSVKQITGSTGMSGAAWPPIHASTATDGESYIMVSWEEPSGTGSYVYYGVQDLITGNWIIKPTLMSPMEGPFRDAANKEFQFRTMHSPKVTYLDGYFYLTAIWVGQNFANNILSYQGFVVPQYLKVSDLAGGLKPSSFYREMPGATDQGILTCPTNFAYDIAMGHWGPFGYSFFIIASQGGTENRTTNIASGIVSNGSIWQLQYATTQQWSDIKDPTVSVRVNSTGPYPFTVALPNYQAYLKQDTTYANSVGWAGNNPYRGPIDATVFGTGGMASLTYDCSASRMAVYFRSYTPNSPTDSRFAINNLMFTSPLNTSYLQILSRLFQKADEPIFYAWIGAAAPTSDSIYNSAYLVEFDMDRRLVTVVARTLYLASAHVTGGDVLWPCDVTRVPGTSRFITFLSAITEKSSGVDFQGFGTLSRVEFDFKPNRNVQIVSLPTGGNMIAGSYPLYYDGATVNEAGFSATPTANAMSQTVAPFKPTLFTVNQITATRSGGFPSNTLKGGPNDAFPSRFQEYYYVICFVRRDAYGNVYRSAPSPVITVSCPNPGGGGAGSPNLVINASVPWGQTVTFPAFTYNGGGNVMIEYYRTTATTPGTYYFLGQVPNGQPFTDSQGDGSVEPIYNNSITKNRTVYTNNNELPNDPPPAVHHMVASESRAYLIPADNRNVVWYSKQFSPGRTVEWCAAFTLSEGLNSGAFTALAILDTYLIVFKEDQVLCTYGNGPDNGGSNGAFAPFSRIASDVGCIDAGSVALIPDGIIFRSRRGIELLTRSLQVTYIGGPVEPLVAELGPISSVVVMPRYTELRLVPSTAGKPVLCYDYGSKRWSTFTNMASAQAREIAGEYWFLSADGSLVNKETRGVYLDNGAPIQMTLETPEIPVGAGGLQGWGRAYRMALLGDFYNDFTLNVQFAYDHSNTYTDAVKFSTAAGLINGDKVFQFRTSRLPRQVMQTLKLKIFDSGTTGQSCAISNIALEVGSKNGLARLADQKTL